MKYLSFKMVLTLTLIAMFSGALLSAWDMITAPRIEKHRQEAIKAAVREVLPPFDSYREIPLGQRSLYEAADSSGNIVGYAAENSGSGFQGEIVIMSGLDPEMETLTGISVLEQLETPGLGTKIVSDPSNKKDPEWFPNQFKDLNFLQGINVLKNQKAEQDNEIMAITGATISSAAVARIVSEDCRMIRDEFQSLQEGKDQ